MKLTRWMAAAALLALAGCGGSDGTPADTSAPMIAVSGTAATGAPMAGAAISLLCNAGGRAITATAGADGKYTMSLPPDCAAPYMLKAELGGTTLHAFSDAAGNINITPLTDIAAYIAARGITAEEYLAIAEGFKQVSALWSTAKEEEIRMQLLAKLGSAGVQLAGLDDFLHSPFDAIAGNRIDDALERLKELLGTVPLSSIGAQFVNAGGSPMDKPWLTLFKPGITSRTLAAGACAFDEGSGPVEAGPVTVTFTLSGEKLLISVAIEGGAPPETLEVGGEGTRFNIFYPGGTDSGRGVGIMAGSGMLSFMTFDPDLGGPFSLPALAFGTPSGGTLYCGALTTRITRESLHAFDIPARVSSVMGTSTGVVSPAEGCAIPNTSPAQTYTYAVSAFGELTLNGQSFTAGQLDEAEASIGYVDGFEWPASGERKAMAALGLVFMPMVRVERTPSAFSHVCDMQPL